VSEIGPHEGNAADALDRIRDGGTNLISIAQQRLSEIKRLLDHGRFHDAAVACVSLQEKLMHLSQAQQSLGRLADTVVIRISDVKAGMTVPEAGVISEVGPCPNCEREGCESINLTFESGASVVLDRDDEICVSSGS
jgi:hypothetical protein